MSKSFSPPAGFKRHTASEKGLVAAAYVAACIFCLWPLPFPARSHFTMVSPTEMKVIEASSPQSMTDADLRRAAMKYADAVAEPESGEGWSWFRRGCVLALISAILSVVVAKLKYGNAANADGLGPANAPLPSYQPPRYAGYTWVLTRGKRKSDGQVTLYRAPRENAPIEIKGLSDGPIQVDLTSEEGESLSAQARCEDHGGVIGAATVVFNGANRIQVIIPEVNRKLTFKKSADFTNRTPRRHRP